MSSDNLIRQNYSSYSTNPNTKYKPEELDKWANSSENYNSFINGEQVEDFQLFDYNSLGNNRNERIEGYKQELDVFSQEYLNQYDADGDSELSIDEFINMQTDSYETIFGEEADDALKTTFENQFNTLSTINPNERYIDESTLKSILGVGQNTNIDSYMEKYDSDGDGKLTFDDYKKFHEDQSEEILGEKTNWDAPGMLEAVRANFNQISKVSSSANTIDSREFATFLGIADAQDGLNDGVISYQNFNSVPALEGYEEATENYYDAFFGDSEENFFINEEQDSSTSSKEFAAFLGVADSQDGLIDGIISYSNFNTVPQQNGYETALKNHYKDFFNN